MALTTLRFLLPFVTTLLGSSLWEVMRYANEQQRRATQARSEQLVTELKFLRSQINPHFLFNTLNNIYPLSLIGDRRAPDSLLQLSGMLRYVLYESETATVPLGCEIAYIRNYVELQQLKDSELSGLSVELDESRPELAIAPLLLVPLVENAFKHGNLGEEEGAFIRIKLTTAPDRIEFAVSNTYSSAPTPKDRTGGIGLTNLRKRLALLYPGDHELLVTDAAATFTATLRLHLSQADGLPDC
jgi:LytS/YehU family sensor histidine kinase